MSQISDDAYLEEDPRQQAPRRRIRYNPRQTRDSKAYLSAERHSRLVRRLRYILPVLAVAGVVVFWGTARFIPGDLASLVKVAGIDVNSNSVVMEKPHISGFEGTRRAYDVKADSAVQNLDDPKVVTFSGIEGTFGLEEGGVATVTATTGMYNGRNNFLQLTKGITVSTTTGYTAKLRTATIELSAGNLSTNGPVELHSAEGTLKANAMAVTDRGKRVLFSKGVSVTYMPPGELVTATGQTEPTAPE